MSKPPGYKELFHMRIRKKQRKDREKRRKLDKGEKWEKERMWKSEKGRCKGVENYGYVVFK
jgi:hypothetical protein